MMPFVLIVDDEPNDLVLTGQIAHELGLKVLSAGTFNQACTILISGPPLVLAIVDLKLVGSEADGIALIGMLTEFQPHVPIVVMTGCIHGDRLEQACEKSPVLVAAKPVTRESLQRILGWFKIKGDHREGST